MNKILIINSAEPGTDKFTSPLELIVKDCGFTPVTIEYQQCTNYDFSEFAGIIISGSPQGDDIVEHHLPYFGWIKTTKLPVFGICAGHHILGFLFGAKLLRSVEPESGDFEVVQIKSDPIFANINLTFVVKQMHNDSITLPLDFNLLATAKTCANQLMKHKHNPLYTSQFHPEFYNKQLLSNFVSLCAKKRVSLKSR